MKSNFFFDLSVENRRSKGTYLSIIQANFGQSHSGLSPTEVVVAGDLKVSRCIHLHKTVSSFTKIKTHTSKADLKISCPFQLLTRVTVPKAGKVACHCRLNRTSDRKW
ncbi:hypothetical protein AMECASPLE_007125 [Ameca splendens]|uniref:Uncharacterized protein n=1 Tax=Ameca splendens TaxID=208324 RepID=A0ABV0XZG4_9TELE